MIDTDFYIPADTLQKFTSKQQYDETKAWLHKIADRFRTVSLESQVPTTAQQPYNKVGKHLKNVNKRRE